MVLSPQRMADCLVCRRSPVCVDAGCGRNRNDSLAGLDGSRHVPRSNLLCRRLGSGEGSDLSSSWAAPVRCILLICVIPTATNCARFIACRLPELSRISAQKGRPSGRSSRAFVASQGRRLGGAASHWRCISGRKSLPDGEPIGNSEQKSWMAGTSPAMTKRTSGDVRSLVRPAGIRAAEPLFLGCPSKVNFCVDQPEGGSSTAGSSVNSSCARPTPRSA